LVGDRKATKVGDVLTVLVVENSSASATSGTQTDKATDAGLKISTPNRQDGYGLGVENSFDGSGKIARSGRLLAQLSVVVVALTSSGDLRVSGEQLVEINGEKQMINLEGLVRRSDIGEANTISSNRIAEAKITYVGEGVLGDAQRKGWITRLITSFLDIF